ncbi:MAG: hypothetical protein Q9204_005659 [Flavoplaca sp. TL-2023a]
MVDSVLRQAVANITSFGRKASPPTEEQQSTQYTDAFGDLIQSDLFPTPDGGLLVSSDERTAIDTETTGVTQSTRLEDTDAAPTPKPQATAMLAPFTLPKSLDTSPAHGFMFGKAVKPAFNTKLTKGPAAPPPKEAEQQSAESNPIPSHVSHTPPDVSNVQVMLQSAGSSHADPEPHRASKAPCTESQQIESSGSSSNESRERPLHQPRGTSLQVNSKQHAVTSKVLAEGMLGSGKPIAEAAGPAPSTITNGTQDEDTAMVDGPTLVNEGSEYTSQRSSRSSSPSPSLGRSLQSYGQTVSNRSFGQQPASKIRKCRTRSRRESLALPESPRQGFSPVDPEDMLKALTIYYRKQMQQRNESRAKQKEQDNTISDFKTIIKLLDTQLQESNERVSKYEAELLKYRKLIPGWQDKVKKLSNFVKGLNNDHARLRDDAQLILGEQQKIRSHKESIDKKLKESVQALEKERSYQYNRLLKAHHRTELAEQLVNARTIDLQSKDASVRLEQDRIINLQNSLNKLASNREDLLVKLANHEVAMSSNIAGLKKTIADAIHDASTREPHELSSKVEECILLLKEPRNVDSVKTEDVQKLHNSIKDNGDRILQLASIYHDSLNTTSNFEGRIASDIGAQIQKITSSIKASQPLEQQLQDLQKVKATILERLQATETHLADSRSKLNTSEREEKAQLQKVAALEAELKTLRTQLQESPLMALRLHDSEKQCQELNQQLSAYQLQLEDTKGDLASRGSEKADLENSLQAARTEIAELRATVDSISLEQFAIEGQAKLDKERLHEYHSKQFSLKSADFRNEIHRLRNVEKDLHASRAEIAMLEGAKKEALAKIESTTQELVSKQTSDDQALQILQKCQRENIQLQQDIEAIRHQDAEKSKQCQNMEAEICQLRDGASKAQEDHEALAQAEKGFLSEKIRIAETSADNSRKQNSQLHKEVADLKKRLQIQSESRVKFIGEMEEQQNKLHSEFDDAMRKTSHENRQLRTQIGVLEADKKLLREQNQTLLDSTTSKLSKQVPRISASPKQQLTTSKNKSKSMLHGGQSSSTSKHRPEKKVCCITTAGRKYFAKYKKAVVVEDSQDRGDTIEESQHPGLQRPSSPDVLNPVTFMPKVIQDLVAAPSSPLTDPPSTPSDAREHVERSPSRPGLVIEDSQAQDQASQELGGYYKTPSRRDIWTISESTTKTKSRSVERSVVKTNQPFLGLTPQFQGSNQVNSPNRQTKMQATQKPQGILKPAGLKRTISQQTLSESSQQTHKRQRVSSQTSIGRQQHGLARTSPVKTAKLSQRKTKQSDKYADKFTAELAKDKK